MGTSVMVCRLVLMQFVIDEDVATSQFNLVLYFLLLLTQVNLLLILRYQYTVTIHTYNSIYRGFFACFLTQ